MIIEELTQLRNLMKLYNEDLRDTTSTDVEKDEIIRDLAGLKKRKAELIDQLGRS